MTFNPLGLLCDDTPDFTLGTVALDDDGNAWIYFEAGADIGRYNAVQLPDEAYDPAKSSPPRLATATDEYGMRVAVPHVAIPIGSFGWGMIYGTPGPSVGARMAPRRMSFSAPPRRQGFSTTRTRRTARRFPAFR